MGKIFCVKFHTKYLTHTLRDVYFIQKWKSASSKTKERIRVFEMIPMNHKLKSYGMTSHALQWRHNECDGIWNHHCLDCLLNHLFRCRKQRKHQSSASLAFVWGIHRWPVNSPYKGPVMQKMFPFDNVIMCTECNPVIDVLLLKHLTVFRL